MLYRYFLLLFLLLGGFASCRDNQKEKDLALREQVLRQREHNFALKEADYRSLIQLRDSLLAASPAQTIDTSAAKAWPEDIAGTWNSKVICTQSNCTDYVIGDQRNERWEFVSDSTGNYARAFNKQQLNRVFKGSFQQESLQLHFETDSAANRQVKMNISLSQYNPTLMKGIQSLEIDNKCTAKFTVELVRISNP